MKKGLFILLLIAILLPAHAQESGIRFFHGTWDEAMALAKKEKKKVFIDFFTEWCGPCLNMALTVFPLPEVGEVYNKNFICLKIDAEKGEGRELAKKYGIHSYPSYIFVNPKTEALIHRSGGNKPAADFIADVQGALNPKLSSIYLNEKYKSGKYDARFLIDYIHNQKVSGNRNVQKDFDKLIAMGKKLTDPEIWELYADCIGGYNNPYVKEVADHYDEFVRLFGKEAVDAKLTEATAYAPTEFTESLCNFDGKYYNLKMAELTTLFQQNKYDEAWDLVDQLAQDKNIDQAKFVKALSFYTRVNPDYNDNELTFEQLAKKIKYTKYVAYNMYDRDEAMPHYYYATALEYLIKRAQEEGKQIPAISTKLPNMGKRNTICAIRCSNRNRKGKFFWLCQKKISVVIFGY